VGEGDDGKDGGWGARLAELARRREAARAMGGEERLARRRAEGRLSARERVERLLDPGSLHELGTLVGGSPDPGEPPRAADAFVAAAGRIDGRPVLVGAEDFTVAGGSIGLGGADKRYRLTQLAAQERVPLVFLLEGAGHRMTNALRAHGRRPNDLQGLADLSGVVPTVCAVMGASAGHGALAAPLMDYVVMVEGASLFSAGPPLVEAATGERVTKEELGGTAVHVRASGVAHDALPDDAAALERVRRYLAFFPSSAWEAPPRRERPDTGPRALDDVLALVPEDPRRPYPVRRLLEELVDAGSLLEVQAAWGASLRTALGFLGGRAVALLANDPSVRAGALDAAAAEKGARFLEVVGAFHLPVVFLADNPGVMAGTRAEREGALRAAARLFAAQHRLRVPKLSVTLRKAFGFGSSVMAMNPFDGQTLSLAWPGVTLGAMPAAGGGAASKADASTQAALDAGEAAGPWRIAHGMGFDEVIDPRETRDALLHGLALADRRPPPAGPVVRVGTLP
jgi:acetyl-CoA carboxylase carboxyltransferase component